MPRNLSNQHLTCTKLQQRHWEWQTTFGNSYILTEAPMNLNRRFNALTLRVIDPEVNYTVFLILKLQFLQCYVCTKNLCNQRRVNGRPESSKSWKYAYNYLHVHILTVLIAKSFQISSSRLPSIHSPACSLTPNSIWLLKSLRPKWSKHLQSPLDY